MIVTRRRALALGGLGFAVAAVGACSAEGDDARGAAPGPSSAPASTPIAYGEHPSQVVDLYLPSAEPDGAPPRAHGLVPVVALVHGGFWQAGYDRTQMAPLAADLVARGWAVLNVEYRSVADDGGGWTGTFDDLAAGLDLLATAPEAAGVDPGRVITVGHSAGGHLALWAAARAGQPTGAPGADPAVRPVAAVSQAGVCDLVTGAEANLGGGACQSLVGGDPTEVPERYEVASPAARVPLGVPQLLVHGTDDTIVPLSQSEQYAEKARTAGDTVDLTLVAGDHFIHLDPTHQAWTTVTDALPGFLPT